MSHKHGHAADPFDDPELEPSDPTPATADPADPKSNVPKADPNPEHDPALKQASPADSPGQMPGVNPAPTKVLWGDSPPVVQEQGEEPIDPLGAKAPAGEQPTK